MRAASEVGRRFASFLDASVASLSANRGVPMVHQPVFPAADAAGTLTDASGDDGVGGYAFSPDRPNEVWIVHGAWDDDIRAALAVSARIAASRRPCRRRARLGGPCRRSR